MEHYQPRNYERGVLAKQQFPADFSIGIPVRMLSGGTGVAVSGLAYGAHINQIFVGFE